MSKLTFLCFVSISAVLGSSFLACSEDAQSAGSRRPQSDDSTDGELSEGDDSTKDELPAGNGTSKQTPKDGGARGAMRGDSGGAKGQDAAATEASSSVASRGLPCDVQEIIDEHCALCHGEKPMFGAPVPLATASDFQATGEDGRKLFQVARERVNEAEPGKRMPPVSAPQLEEDALAKLDAWLEAGAKASTEKCMSAKPSTDAGSAAPHSTEGLECYRLTAHNGDGKTPYKVGVAADSYINFTFAAPWLGTEAYAVVLSPIIDNSEVLHHYLFYQDNIPGGASGPAPSSGAHPTGELLHGWAPGGETLNLRERGLDVGLQLSGNSTFTIETHYNSRDANAVDASGIEVCVASKKPENIAAISFLGYDQLGIPATNWTGTCVPTGDQSARILGVSPHMHLQGRHMKATINRADGTKEILHDAPFEFEYQRHYDKDVMINPGDTITTECTFAQPMAWGEGTGQEMCLLFVHAYPRGVLVDYGPWGILAHGDNTCLGQ